MVILPGKQKVFLQTQSLEKKERILGDTRLNYDGVRSVKNIPLYQIQNVSDA